MCTLTRFRTLCVHSAPYSLTHSRSPPSASHKKNCINEKKEGKKLSDSFFVFEQGLSSLLPNTWFPLLDVMLVKSSQLVFFSVFILLLLGFYFFRKGSKRNGDAGSEVESMAFEMRPPTYSPIERTFFSSSFSLLPSPTLRHQFRSISCLRTDRKKKTSHCECFGGGWKKGKKKRRERQPHVYTRYIPVDALRCLHSAFTSESQLEL